MWILTNLSNSSFNIRYIVGTIVKKSITSKKIKDKYENVIVMLVFGSISTQNMVKK